MKSQPIFIYDRVAKRLVRELVPGGGLLALQYASPLGRFVTDALMSRKLVSRFYGRLFYTAWSRRWIEPFARQNHVPMDEAAVPNGGFKSFNDFFIRRLKPGSRPLPADPRALIAPADSRLKAFPLNTQTVLDVKGHRLTVADLTAGADVARQFSDGICLQFRLAPCDYHRFGYICDGMQGEMRNVPGRLYSVSPLAMALRPFIWGQNFRQWCIIESGTLGPVLEIDVGATNVGSIVQHQPAGGPCERGAEKGYFQLGGSTVLIILPPGRVELDPDIEKYSRRGIETRVRYGEKVGRVV
jgi:phosphatidylserine decarboxylase